MSLAEETYTTTGNPCPHEHASGVNVHPPQPVEVMAAVLRVMGVDLDDEREVTRVLIAARFGDEQVVAYMDQAIALARIGPVS